MHEGRAVLNYKDTTQRQLRLEEIDPEQSILAQRKDPDHHPELTYLGEVFGRIRLYREWSFGRHTPPRRPQPADLPNDFLGEDGRNLGLVLNRLKRESQAKARILEALRRLYADLTDFDVIIEGGTVQVFLQEQDRSHHFARKGNMARADIPSTSLRASTRQGDGRLALGQAARRDIEAPSSVGAGLLAPFGLPALC